MQLTRGLAGFLFHPKTRRIQARDFPSSEGNLSPGFRGFADSPWFWVRESGGTMVSRFFGRTGGADGRSLQVLGSGGVLKCGLRRVSENVSETVLEKALESVLGNVSQPREDLRLYTRAWGIFF